MAASDRMRFDLGPRHLTTSGEILLSELKEAAKELNKYREQNGFDKLDIPKARDRKKLYNFLKEYIEFKNNDGSDYVEITGRGEPLTEIIEQNPPVLEYDDVKNDPYFITK